MRGAPYAVAVSIGKNPPRTRAIGLRDTVPFHMQYKEYDPFIEAALQSTFAAYGPARVGATFTAAMAAGTITASAALTGNSAVTTLQRGQWLRFVTTGTPSDPNNGKLFRVSSTVSPTATVITLAPSTPATVAASLTNSVLQTSRLTNGVTQPSFTLEKAFADIVQFLTYRGQTVSELSLQFASESLTNGTLDFMGKDAISAATTALPGALIASQTFDVHNAATGVGQIWEGGAPIDVIPDYADGFAKVGSLRSTSEALGKEIIIEGACSLELVLDTGRLPKQLVPISVAQIEWYPRSNRSAPMRPISTSPPSSMSRSTRTCAPRMPVPRWSRPSSLSWRTWTS